MNSMKRQKSMTSDELPKLKGIQYATGEEQGAISNGKEGKGEGAADDEMVRQHHRLNGREFEQTGNSEGQGRLACCSP